MVNQRRYQDASNDRQGSLETRREDKCEELRLVANFSKGDHAG